MKCLSNEFSTMLVVVSIWLSLQVLRNVLWDSGSPCRDFLHQHRQQVDWNVQMLPCLFRFAFGQVWVARKKMTTREWGRRIENRLVEFFVRLLWVSVFLRHFYETLITCVNHCYFLLVPGLLAQLRMWTMALWIKQWHHRGGTVCHALLFLWSVL